MWSTAATMRRSTPPVQTRTAIAVHLEWDDEYQEDGYYTIGTHTIRVRAVDEWGATSEWVSQTIEFHNDPQ